MRIEILEKEDDRGYTIVVEGEFFRYCKTYSELATTMGCLVKSKYLKDMEGFCS